MPAHQHRTDGRRRCAANWEREAEHARGSARTPIGHIRDAVQQGQSLTEALDRTGNYFPELFHEMVDVGENTGHLAEVLRQLAEHYQHRLELKKAFRRSITGPMFQLGFALFVVGLLIWLMGLIGQMNGGKPIDLLGFGLIGEDGLKKYLAFLAAVAFAGWFVYRQVQRGVWWGATLQRLVMKIPKVGGALEMLALSRFCWSMQLTLDTDMPLRRALDLAFRSTHNVRYTDQIEAVLLSVRQGHSLTDTLTDTRAFPRDFLESVHVGEQSGRLTDTFSVLADHYQEEGRAAVRTLTMVAGGAVWAIVTGLIVFLIFRLAMFYINTINDAVRGAGGR